MSKDADRLDKFLDALTAELLKRYHQCPGTAPADTVLLAVANAIAEARK